MSETSKETLIVCQIVTYNSAATIRTCLESVLHQEGFPIGTTLRIRVIDNASTDETRSILNDFAETVSVELSNANSGFCDAHNRGISWAVAAGAEYIFILNPDVRMEPRALALLVGEMQADPSVAAATPKILRGEGSSLKPLAPPIVDAAGMFITPEVRHFDRGSGEIDHGQFENPQYVFGGTGAALLLRRKALDDLNLSEGSEYEIFSSNYFAYREDADLAWRMQWLGWRTRYVPKSIIYHERKVLPERRRELPPFLNRLGVKNRFLLQIQNIFIATHLPYLPALLWRNCVVIGGVLFTERESLSAFSELWHQRKRALKNRRFIQRQRKVSALSMRRWFSVAPISEPALEELKTPERIRSVTALIVNFNSGVRVEECVRHLVEARKELSEIDLQVIVVDNASDDRVANQLQNIYGSNDGCRWILSPENLGFAGAINRALTQIETDATLILNPDVIVSSTTVKGLAESLGRYRNLGAIAPVLVSADGVPQLGFTARRFPTLGSTLAELFFLHRIWPKNPWSSRYHLRDDLQFSVFAGNEPEDSRYPRQIPYCVEQPAGACLLVRTGHLRSLGGFDAEFWPAWYEDVDFFKRLRASGYLGAVRGDTRVVHEGGYTRRVLTDDLFREFFGNNLIRYWSKHGTPFEADTIRHAAKVALAIRGIRQRLRELAAALFSPPDIE